MKRFKVVPVEALEAMSRAVCQSGKFETGEGGCAPICMEALGRARIRCRHVTRVHGDLVRKMIGAAPTEPTEAVDALVEALQGMLVLHIAHHNDPVHVAARAALDRARKAGIGG